MKLISIAPHNSYCSFNFEIAIIVALNLFPFVCIRSYLLLRFALFIVIALTTFAIVITNKEQ